MAQFELLLEGVPSVSGCHLLNYMSHRILHSLKKFFLRKTLGKTLRSLHVIKKAERSGQDEVGLVTAPLLRNLKLRLGIIAHVPMPKFNELCVCVSWGVCCGMCMGVFGICMCVIVFLCMVYMHVVCLESLCFNNVIRRQKEDLVLRGYHTGDKPGMVAHTCHASTGEGSRTWI